MTAEDGAGADTLADNLADRGRQSWVDDAGVRWTRTAFEDSDAEALYCPVWDAGQWNGVMEKLHSRNQTLGRRWRDTKRRRYGRTARRPRPGAGADGERGEGPHRALRNGGRRGRNRDLGSGGVRRSRRPRAARDRRIGARRRGRPGGGTPCRSGSRDRAGRPRVRSAPRADECPLGRARKKRRGRPWRAPTPRPREAGSGARCSCPTAARGAGC